MMFKDPADQRERENDKSPSSVIITRLVDVESQLRDVGAKVDGMQAEHAQLDRLIREAISAIGAVNRGRKETTERAEERHAEIMSMLTEFKEKGVRRK